MSDKRNSVRVLDFDADVDDKDVTAVVEVESLPGWRFEIKVVRIDGVPTLTRLVVEPDGPPAPITTRLLAAIPTGLLTRSAGVAVSAYVGRAVWGEEFDRKPRPGRRGRGDDFYVALAVDYLARCAASASPVDDMAKERNLSPSQVRNLLYEARRRELLSKGVPGHAGGELTARAKEILDER